MVDFNREELLKIAKLSALELTTQELELFENQIRQIISFVQHLQDVSITHQAPSTKNVNLMRQDIVQQAANPQELLKLAPQTLNNYFVVPKILD